MKKIFVIIAVLFIATASLHAQSTISDTKKHTKTTAAQPVVTKGYYSIYKNSDQLNHSSPLISIKTTGYETDVMQPQKGYYSMNNHHKKIYKSGVSFIAKQQKRPVASKGYYNMSMPSNELTKDRKHKIDLSQPVKLDSLFAVAD